MVYLLQLVEEVEHGQNPSKTFFEAKLFSNFYRVPLTLFNFWDILELAIIIQVFLSPLYEIKDFFKLFFFLKSCIYHVYACLSVIVTLLFILLLTGWYVLIFPHSLKLLMFLYYSHLFLDEYLPYLYLCFSDFAFWFLCFKYSIKSLWKSWKSKWSEVNIKKKHVLIFFWSY